MYDADRYPIAHTSAVNTHPTCHDSHTDTRSRSERLRSREGGERAATGLLVLSRPAPPSGPPQSSLLHPPDRRSPAPIPLSIPHRHWHRDHHAREAEHTNTGLHSSKSYAAVRCGLCDAHCTEHCISQMPYTYLGIVGECGAKSGRRPDPPRSPLLSLHPRLQLVASPACARTSADQGRARDPPPLRETA